MAKITCGKCGLENISDPKGKCERCGEFLFQYYQNKKKRRITHIAITLVIVLVAAIILGYVVAGPFIDTIYRIKSGIKKDMDKISANTNYSTLRTNLKKQFKSSYEGPTYKNYQWGSAPTSTMYEDLRIPELSDVSLGFVFKDKQDPNGALFLYFANHLFEVDVNKSLADGSAYTDLVNEFVKQFGNASKISNDNWEWFEWRIGDVRITLSPKRDGTGASIGYFCDKVVDNMPAAEKKEAEQKINQKTEAAMKQIMNKLQADMSKELNKYQTNEAKESNKQKIIDSFPEANLDSMDLSPEERQTLKARHNDSNILNSYPFDVVEKEPWKSRFMELIGSKYQQFCKNITVSSEVEIHGDWAVGQGIAPHSGGSNEAIFAINLNTGKTVAMMLENGNTFTKFGFDSWQDAPPYMRNWWKYNKK